VPEVPLDHPQPGRPFRLYAALTNHCNRACPWCSTCSAPAGDVFLEPARLAGLLASLGDGPYELQLEGGEPTTHPAFWSFVSRARADLRCARLILCTNGVVLPRSPARLRAWVERLGAPLTLKLSVNHHLLGRDPGLIGLCVMLRDVFEALGGNRLLVLNVRRRRGAPEDDAWVMEAVRAAGLEAMANDFFLQRYGFAVGEAAWDPPFAVADRFVLVNPDGTTHGTDLFGRSEAMRALLD
jgi:hypothetical protein